MSSIPNFSQLRLQALQDPALLFTNSTSLPALFTNPTVNPPVVTPNFSDSTLLNVLMLLANMNQTRVQQAQQTPAVNEAPTQNAGGNVRIAQIDSFKADNTGFNHGEEVAKTLKAGGDDPSLNGKVDLDQFQADSTSDIGNALDQIIQKAQNGEKLDAVVIPKQNFANDSDSKAVRDKIDRLASLGIPVIVAAGNEGPGKKNSLVSDSAFAAQSTNGGKLNSDSGIGNISSNARSTSFAAANLAPLLAKRHAAGQSVDQIKSEINGGQLAPLPADLEPAPSATGEEAVAPGEAPPPPPEADNEALAQVEEEFGQQQKISEQNARDLSKKLAGVTVSNPEQQAKIDDLRKFIDGQNDISDSNGNDIKKRLASILGTDTKTSSATVEASKAPDSSTSNDALKKIGTDFKNKTSYSPDEAKELAKRLEAINVDNAEQQAKVDKLAAYLKSQKKISSDNNRDIKNQLSAITGIQSSTDNNAQTNNDSGGGSHENHSQSGLQNSSDEGSFQKGFSAGDAIDSQFGGNGFSFSAGDEIDRNSEPSDSSSEDSNSVGQGDTNRDASLGDQGTGNLA